MWAGLPNCNSQETGPAQAIDAGDTGKLPPWLKNAQKSAVVARLRRKLEARGDKPYLGDDAGRVPSLVRTTSEFPEVATRVEQAEKEADRLRMELSEVKEQLDNSEMATTKVVHELVSSKRELNAARDELEGSATAAENAAKRAEADVATLHSELEVVRSELAGKVSELNEKKRQLDLARMQLRIFKETHAENSRQAGLDLAVVNAQFGAMNKILAEVSKGEHKSNQKKMGHQKKTNAREQLMGKKSKGKPQNGFGEGIHGKHSQADQISKSEAELESAQNAQVELQDASWMMKEPSDNMLHAKSGFWLDSDSSASCMWHPHSLPVMSQFCTQVQLAASRQQQYMLQQQQQQQQQQTLYYPAPQQQQTLYYPAPQQQQPQHQMDVSQYYQALQQPQQSVQDPSPGHLEVLGLLQIRVDCMMNFVEAADGQRLKVQLPAESRSQIVNMARATTNWMKETSVKDELLQRINVLDASMTQVMSNLK